MNPHHPHDRFRGRYRGTPRSGRGFKPRTPQRSEYQVPSAGNNMPPFNRREPNYYSQSEQTPVYQQNVNYGQYLASGPGLREGPTFGHQPLFPPQQINRYQQNTPPSYLPQTESNINQGHLQDVQARQPGNATIYESDPVEFLLDRRPLTTFIERFTTSDHVCFAVEVDGREFIGYGITKIMAKQNAASEAVRRTFDAVCTYAVLFQCVKRWIRILTLRVLPVRFLTQIV